jgi:hypothetical protein
MQSGRALFLLSKLTTGERQLVEQLKTQLDAKLAQPGNEVGTDFALTTGVSEHTADTLAQLYALDGWRAGLGRGRGLVLRLIKSN